VKREEEMELDKTGSQERKKEEKNINGKVGYFGFSASKCHTLF